jgi:regulator of protease activity HflC (stomatin/prohibitin superfamily)
MTKSFQLKFCNFLKVYNFRYCLEGGQHVYILALILIVFFLATAIRIIREYERGVIFRLGRVIKTKGPDFIILIPIIDKMVKVSLRLVTMDVPP